MWDDVQQGPVIMFLHAMGVHPMGLHVCIMLSSMLGLSEVDGWLFTARQEQHLLRTYIAHAYASVKL
jgi:hypothetical protein